VGDVLEYIAAADRLVVERGGLCGADDAVYEEPNDGDEEDAGHAERHDDLDQRHAGRYALRLLVLAALVFVGRRHGKALVAEMVSEIVWPR
jgi:hypothetical protein